jgi:hypothetical protein
VEGSVLSLKWCIRCMGKNVSNIKCVFLSAVQILFEIIDNVKISVDDFQFINHQQLETVIFNTSVTVI